MNEVEIAHDEDCERLLGLLENVRAISARMAERERTYAELCDARLTHGHVSAKMIAMHRDRLRDFRERAERQEQERKP